MEHLGTTMRQRNVAKKFDYQKDAVASKASVILKKIDVYPKLHRELKVQTQSGATVSIITAGIMIVLFICELSEYLTLKTSEHMIVDPTIGERLKINFNISFPSLSCQEAHMDAMDVAGDLQIDLHQHVYKRRLDVHQHAFGDEISSSVSKKPLDLPADYCGDCYGATPPNGAKCCNTCEELKYAYINQGWSTENIGKLDQCVREGIVEDFQSQPGEGCQMFGYMTVNKVAGNFHVALGRTFQRNGKLVHQFMSGDQQKYNASHHIHSLSFGDSFPGQVNPLDNRLRIADKGAKLFQYYIKIVPTVYTDAYSSLRSNQYSLTEREHDIPEGGSLTMLPGVFFMFDISPFMVNVTSKSIPFTHFLTKVCAIIGGTVTIAGILDSIIYHYSKLASWKRTLCKS